MNHDEALQALLFD